MERLCAHCNAPLVGKRGNAKYCSKRCGYGVRNEKYKLKNGGPLPGVNTGTAGRIGELLVSIDLLKRGGYVFHAVSPSSPCDLVFIKGTETILIEVTTGFRAGTNKLMYPPHEKNSHIFDVIAVIERNGTITYFPPLEEVIKL